MNHISDDEDVWVKDSEVKQILKAGTKSNRIDSGNNYNYALLVHCISVQFDNYKEGYKDPHRATVLPF